MIRIITRPFASRTFEKTYYSILGVPTTASLADIKAAYFHLAKSLHPDQPTGNESKFKEVKEAYEVLGNEESRARYDAEMREPQQQTSQEYYYQYQRPREGFGGRNWTQWSRTYYYHFDPFTGKRTFYEEDFQPKGRRNSARTREQDFFKDWEEFTRKFNQSFSEQPSVSAHFSPYFKAGFGLFLFLWVWSILEKLGQRSMERDMYYDRSYRP
jgi:curved DNA-binding protein CbpA